MSQSTHTYEIKADTWHKGQLLRPAAAGQPAATVTMTEREARYHLLAGALALPAAQPASNGQ